MTQHRSPVALLILQWVLALVIVGESIRFAFSAAAARAFAQTGLPDFVHLSLAWVEIAAALLFLVPRATIAGGRLLIGVMAFAIVVHLLHGWFDVGALLVYAAAVWAVMTIRREAASNLERI